MKIDIGRVFSNTFAMVKERWLLMIGLWAVFFGVLILYGGVIGGILGVSVMAMSGGMFSPDSLENPAALGGVGIAVIVFGLVFYIGYFAILLGQQGAMTAIATPLEKLNFGEAFSRGLKGGVTFLGVLLLLMLIYLAVAVVGAVLSFMGEVVVLIVVVLFIPVMIYLACRFTVIVPVIVVEQVFNPIKALTRTWTVTSGNVLGILVVYIAYAIIAMVVIALPFFIMFGSVISGGDIGAGAIVGVLFGFLFFFVAIIAFSLFSTALNASLHAEMSDTKVAEMERTFE